MNTMRLPRLTYWQPGTMAELIDLKGAYGERCAIMGGGTDLIPRLKRRCIPTRHLVSIRGIPEQSEISREEDGRVRIGAGVILRDIIDDRLVSRSYPLLARAARSVATNQLRNMGTLGGNLCLDNRCPYDGQSELWWARRANCFKRGGNTCYVGCCTGCGLKYIIIKTYQVNPIMALLDNTIRFAIQVLIIGKTASWGTYIYVGAIV